MYLFFFNFFSPFGLLQNIKQHFLCCTVDSCWLSNFLTLFFGGEGMLTSMYILVLCTGTESTPPTVVALILNHRTTRKVQLSILLINIAVCTCQKTLFFETE